MIVLSNPGTVGNEDDNGGSSTPGSTTSALVCWTTTSRNCRGPNRHKKRTPQQTRHYRNRCKSCRLTFTSRSNSFQEDTCLTEENVCCTDSQSSESDKEMSLDTEGAPSSLVDKRNQPKLFPGLLLTIGTSSLVTSSYISRHHLSWQVQEDLLHLLQLYVPKNTSLPTCLYTFEYIAHQKFLFPLSVYVVCATPAMIAAYTVEPRLTVTSIGRSPAIIRSVW